MRPEPINPDWAAVRRRTLDAPWARDILEAVRVDHDYWREHLAVPPPGTDSGWGHHYFCGDDGAALLFDPTSPHRHACPSCGRIYTGEPWDGAWRARMHGAAGAQAQRAALLARLSHDPAEARAAAAGLADLVTTYARDYASYALHGQNAGQGRVQPQSLDEAVWVIGLLRAVRWADNALDQQAVRAASDLAAGVVEVLRPQLDEIHNIHCWLVAALAECAVRTGDSTLLTECRDGRVGAEAQIRAGFHPEGIWFEINAHYHYYALSALLSYREATGPAGLSPDAAARLARATTAPVMLAYDDGRIPAYGDGWPDSYIATFAPQAEAAHTLLPEHPLPISAYYTHPRTGPVQLWYGNERTTGPSTPLTGRGSVAALLFGPDDIEATTPPPRESFVWPHAGIGVLRSADVRLTMRFGPHSGWHDHHDKLAVDAQTSSGWSSLDLGTSGYGAEITQWMRSPVAHNLLILDGEHQPELTGRLIEASDRQLVAEATWGPGTVRRGLTLTDHGWTDTATITAPAGTTVEWVFHGDGRPVGDAARTTDASPLADDDLGHGWLRDLHHVAPGTDGVLRLRWDTPGSPTLELPIPPGTTALFGVADANPTGQPLGVLMVRTTVPAGGAAELAASFTVDG